MSDVQWVMKGQLDPTQDYFAVATDGLRIPIWHLSGFRKLSRYTNANIEQMKDYDELIGYALNTKIEFPMTNSSTLSVWKDMQAIRDYTYKGAHSESMTELGKLKSLNVKHAFWKFNGADGMPTWEDGLAHIYRTKAKGK